MARTSPSTTIRPARRSPPRHAGLRQSSAWPLALAWLALIVYASLHPFSGWHGPAGDTPADWLALLRLPAPQSSRFDLWSNFLAYQPLGLLLAIAWMRSGRPTLVACLAATLAGVLLSLAMECTQHLLPTRVPSRIDWAVNSAGTLVGATLAALLRDAGALALWQRLRTRWFVPHGNAGLALLLTWPVALLFPPPLPLGLGQGLARAALALQEALDDSPLAEWVPLPVPTSGGGAQSSALELVVIVAGLLAPCWVAFVMSRQTLHRLVLLGLVTLAGLGATTLSTLLNFGPEHALAWVTPALGPALGMGLALGAVLALLPRRLVAALGLVGITSLIALVTHSGADPYFASSLQAWEQGRFIRFHGVAQWVGWVWPFAALGFLLLQVAATPDPPPTIPT